MSASLSTKTIHLVCKITFIPSSDYTGNFRGVDYNLLRLSLGVSGLGHEILLDGVGVPSIVAIHQDQQDKSNAFPSFVTTGKLIHQTPGPPYSLRFEPHGDVLRIFVFPDPLMFYGYMRYIDQFYRLTDEGLYNVYVLDQLNDNELLAGTVRFSGFISPDTTSGALARVIASL